MLLKVLVLVLLLGSTAALLPLFYRSPRAGVLALLIVAPLEKISLYAGLTAKPFLLILPALALAVAWRWWKDRETVLVRGRFESMLAAILLIYGLSALAAEEPMRAVRMTIQFGFLFFLSAVVAGVLRTRQDFDKAFKTLLLTGLGVMLYGFFQFSGWVIDTDTHVLMKIMPRNPTIPYMFTIPGAVVMPEVGSIVRLSSTFYDWNIFAAYVVLLLCVGLSIGIRRLYLGRPSGRMWAYVLLGVFTLFFSFSRSNWIGMLVALVALAAGWAPFFRNRRAQIGSVMILILLVGGFATSVGPFGAIRDRMEMTFQGDASIYKHAVYAQAALEMFRRFPAFGVGLHNFSVYYNHHFDPDDFGSTAHSAYLGFFAETGLIGAVANLMLMLLLLSALYRIVRDRRPEEPEYAWAVGLGAAWLGLLTSSLFYHFYNQVYVWVVAGMIVALDRFGRHQNRVESDEDTL